jgi:hypothetical protein
MSIGVVDSGDSDETSHSSGQRWPPRWGAFRDTGWQWWWESAPRRVYPTVSQRKPTTLSTAVLLRSACVMFQELAEHIEQRVTEAIVRDAADDASNMSVVQTDNFFHQAGPGLDQIR